MRQLKKSGKVIFDKRKWDKKSKYPWVPRKKSKENNFKNNFRFNNLLQKQIYF